MKSRTRKSRGDKWSALLIAEVKSTTGTQMLLPIALRLVRAIEIPQPLVRKRNTALEANEVPVAEQPVVKVAERVVRVQLDARSTSSAVGGGEQREHRPRDGRCVCGLTGDVRSHARRDEVSSLQQPHEPRVGRDHEGQLFVLEVFGAGLKRLETISDESVLLGSVPTRTICYQQRGAPKFLETIGESFEEHDDDVVLRRSVPPSCPSSVGVLDHDVGKDTMGKQYVDHGAEEAITGLGPRGRRASSTLFLATT